MKNKDAAGFQVTDVVLAVLGLLYLIGSFTFLRACERKEDGTWMNCHKAWIAIAVCAGVTAALALLHMVIANVRIKMLFSILIIAAALVSAILPGNVIHLCMMPEMKCNAVMRPAAVVLSVLCIAAAAADILVKRKQL